MSDGNSQAFLQMRIEQIEELKRLHGIQGFFHQALGIPKIHWFFTQGRQAAEAGLNIPAVLSLVNGIEASLRITLKQIEPGYAGNLELDRCQIMSNKLLIKALDAGLPVQCLAFNGESNYRDLLFAKSAVQIVAVTNDLCHGNILDHIETVDGTRITLLTPESLRSLTVEVLRLSYHWVYQLSHFRHKHGRRPVDWLPIPDIPDDPLLDFQVS